MFLNVCKQTFHMSHGCISQKVKDVFMWNFQHIIFIWKRRYWQIFKSAKEHSCSAIITPHPTQQNFYNDSISVSSDFVSNFILLTPVILKLDEN